MLDDRPENPAATLVLAHGAGGAMDSRWMHDVTGLLVGRGIRVVRFEFGYMAGRREGRRTPPPRAERLAGEYRDAVAAVRPDGPLLVGGKSMGGRVASYVADELHAAGTVAGLVCLGYPFHPPGKPENLRTEHLEHLRTPSLIVQGTRDPFGTRDEVAGYPLSDAIAVHWLVGDHELKPRKADDVTFAQNLATAADAVAGFANSLGGR